LDLKGKIVAKKKLASQIYDFTIHHPYISRHAKPGQFVVIRLSEQGERIPLTIAGTDGNSFRMVVKAVGKTTYQLCLLQEGNEIIDIVGPLGKPSEIRDYGNVLLVGGGVGIATLMPIAKALKSFRNTVIAVLGGRSKEQVIMLDEFKKIVDEVVVTTDDGSLGIKGVVTDAVGELSSRYKFDQAWAVGPTVMMKFCSMKAKELKIPLLVSLNPIMVDGTGMCGACRVTVGDEIKFACVDGPEFDGTKVDWDELLKRLSQYREEEKVSMELFQKKVGDLSWL